MSTLAKVGRAMIVIGALFAVAFLVAVHIAVLGDNEQAADLAAVYGMAAFLLLIFGGIFTAEF